MKKKLLFFTIIIGLFFIPNVYAETYDGDYSIEYLLRNYNAVTLGHHNKKDFIAMSDNHYSTNITDGGCIQDVTINGPILANGGYISTVDPQYGRYISFGNNNQNIKSFVKGDIGQNVIVNSEIVTDSNYLDFEKMYSSVVTESQLLAANSEYFISTPKIEISKPGIYTINNTAGFLVNAAANSYIRNTILIKNYDKDAKYVFNYYDEYVYELPNIMILESNESNAIPLDTFINRGGYTGNIILNYPNALFVGVGAHLISFGYGQNFYAMPVLAGALVAPKANVILDGGNRSTSIIANSINSNYAGSINPTYYSIDKNLVDDIDCYYTEEAIDYDDDKYTRDYSIKDLLENYSLVTLGHKEIDSKSKLAGYGPGSIKFFHITGQALINGDLTDSTAFDLESNKVTESYISGNTLRSAGGPYTKSSVAVIQPWDNMDNDNFMYVYKKNKLLASSMNKKNYYDYFGEGNLTGSVDNYINFDRLYDNVVSEQAKIEEGEKVATEEVTHLKIGGNYVIDDINSINEIVFDDFDKEKDELTIITIKNSGDINFPLISKDTGSYKGIVTNDYFGKEKATHLYEVDTFISEDSYHGNIVWNVPNATYIELKENAPFAGHLIAPNADVETPELHFAGCFIVNSIYGEGNTEAHFYPITVKPKCECQEYEDLSEYKKAQYSSYKLRMMLGGEGTTVEKTIVGDEEEYQADISNYEVISNKCNEAPPSSGSITEILTNPKTYRKLGLIILLLMPFAYLLLKKKNKLVK